MTRGKIKTDRLSFSSIVILETLSNIFLSLKKNSNSGADRISIDPEKSFLFRCISENVDRDSAPTEKIGVGVGCVQSKRHICQKHNFYANVASQVKRTHFSLFSRWKLLQLGLDEHYKKLNEFRNREVPTTQDFLSVAVHYPWARAISQNKVPYYIKWVKMNPFFLMSESPSVQNKTTKLLSPGWAAAAARGFKTLSRCSKRITLVVSTEHISALWVKLGSAGKKCTTAEKSKLNSSISCAL